jgi:hypothetical protein
MSKSDPIRLRNNFINPIRSEMYIFVPKSERIRSDLIGFGSDLHTSSPYTNIICVFLNFYSFSRFTCIVMDAILEKFPQCSTIVPIYPILMPK